MSLDNIAIHGAPGTQVAQQSWVRITAAESGTKVWSPNLEPKAPEVTGEQSISFGFEFTIKNVSSGKDLLQRLYDAIDTHYMGKM